MPEQDLLSHQSQALANVRAHAHRAMPRARSVIEGVLTSAEIPLSRYAEAVERLSSVGQIALHFHPERLSRSGESVIMGLLHTGEYKNQFETGLSSGSTSAYPGGRRDRWEEYLFGAAYHSPHSEASDRPKYGALQIIDHPDGPAPRFGSCYFLLRPRVSHRSTFTFGGSHEDGALERSGTIDTLDPVLAPLLVELAQGEGAFGVNTLTIDSLLSHLESSGPERGGDPQSRPLGRALDSFIEAQVHGRIRLDEDVDELVADPAFRDQSVGELLAEVSARYGCSLTWHPGFCLSASEVPEEFRGFSIRALAARVAVDGILNAANVGAAANSLIQNPDAWESGGTREELLTQFRRLWHVLVLHGRSASHGGH